MTNNFSKLEASFIEKSFNNPPQIVFETTEKCNLACHYCTPDFVTQKIRIL